LTEYPRRRASRCRHLPLGNPPKSGIPDGPRTPVYPDRTVCFRARTTRVRSLVDSLATTHPQRFRSWVRRGMAQNDDYPGSPLDQRVMSDSARPIYFVPMATARRPGRARRRDGEGATRNRPQNSIQVFAECVGTRAGVLAYRQCETHGGRIRVPRRALSQLGAAFQVSWSPPFGVSSAARAGLREAIRGRPTRSGGGKHGVFSLVLAGERLSF